MTDPYKFFYDLRDNNNREWFALHKGEYDEIRQWWTDGMEQVRALVAPYWPEVQHGRLKTFRIYRDTRFSLDKTPYKTHIGSTLAPVSARNVHSSGFYIELGIPTDDSGVFAGIWAPESKDLNKLRHAIVDNIDEWEDIMNNPDFRRYYPEWFGERLKTAPKGWPKDHPQIEYLRLKHLGRQSVMSPELFSSPRWQQEIADRIIAGLPLVQFLDYSLNEEL